MTSEQSVLVFLQTCQDRDFLERAQKVLTSRLQSLGGGSSSLAAAAAAAAGTTATNNGGGSNSSSSASSSSSSPSSTTAPPSAAAAPSTMDRVMDEIISTEVSYQSDLRTMISLYVAPLKRSQTLSAQQQSALFSNVEVLYDLSTRILGDLKSGRGSGSSSGGADASEQVSAIVGELFALKHLS